MLKTSRLPGGRRRGAIVFPLTLFAALLFLPAAQSGAGTPSSGWYSGNPVLGPATLTSLATAGGTGYAAGTNGTLLKSSDGGTTWTGVVTGIRDDLRIVSIVGDSPNSVVVGTGSFLERSDNGGQTFTRLSFGSGDTILVAAAFPSAQIGYLVLDDGSVLSTTDGGKTFTRRTTIPGGRTPTDLIAVSNTTAFAVTEGGKIERTTDGAVSWTLVGSTSTGFLRGIEQADATTMYAVGDGLTFLKSVDAGATWVQKPVTGIENADLTSIRTSGPDTALLTTSTKTGNQVIRTTDGGATFTSLVPSSDSTYAAAFVTPTRAITVGARGSVQVSSDAGANWTAVGSRIEGTFKVLHAASSQVAYAAGYDGLLARTVDGGQSWVDVSPPGAGAIWVIGSASPDTVFVADNNGLLQRSVNGGASWQILETGTPYMPEAVLALDSKRVVLVGTNLLRRSTDGGETFRGVVAPKLRKAVLVGAQRVGGALFAWGSRLFVSKDGGATWKTLPTPKRSFISEASFVTTRLGYVLDGNHKLWRTTNAGKTWEAINSLGSWRVTWRDNLYVRGLAFSNAKHGFILVKPIGGAPPGAYLLRTNDAGKTWHPQFVSGGPAAAIDSAGATSYLLVGESVLYATTTGGDTGTSAQLSIATKPNRLTKPSSVAVTGLLRPAQGGEDVIVSCYMNGHRKVQHATVASNGRFSTRWTVRKTAVFVAQTYASADRGAAGTPALTVKLIPKKH